MHAGLPRSPLLSFNSFALSFPSTRSFVSFSSLRPTLLTILKTFAHKQHVVTTIYVLLELPGHCYFPCFPKPSSFPACTNFQEKKRTRHGNETEDKLRVLIPKKSIQERARLFFIRSKNTRYREFLFHDNCCIQASF